MGLGSNTRSSQTIYIWIISPHALRYFLDSQEGSMASSISCNRLWLLNSLHVNCYQAGFRWKPKPESRGQNLTCACGRVFQAAHLNFAEVETCLFSTVSFRFHLFLEHIKIYLLNNNNNNNNNNNIIYSYIPYSYIPAASIWVSWPAERLCDFFYQGSWSQNFTAVRRCSRDPVPLSTAQCDLAEI